MNATDERGVVLDWFLKMVLVLAILGAFVFDAGSLAVNYIGLDSTANDIATALAPSLSTGQTLSAPAMQAEARQLARDAHARLVRFRVDAGGTVHIRIRRTAKTLILGHISALKKWTRATASATERAAAAG